MSAQEGSPRLDLPVILLGGGGHGRVLLDVLRLRAVTVLGITDPHPEGVRRVLGVAVLGPDSAVFNHDLSTILLVNGLGSTRDTRARHRLFESFRLRGYSFASLVHPGAIVAGDVLRGEGVLIMAGAVVQPGARLGANVLVNTRASIDHDCVIGDHVHLAPGVTLSGGVVVGAGAHVGTGATVIEGVRIGARALVGAGALVLRDVLDDARVAGVPARELARSDAHAAEEQQ